MKGWRKQNMKIAVPTEENQIFQHFGKCPVFTVFEVKDGKIEAKTTADTSQNGHAALAGFLKNMGTDVVICGGIGDGAKKMLSAAGIKLISGIEGSIDGAVTAYLAGSLSDMGGACSHEEHEHDHTCNCKNHCE